MSVARYFRPSMRGPLLYGFMPAWLSRHPRKSYIIACILSTPPWVDRQELEALRLQAKEMTRTTGIQHVLDHIVPLCHPYVCGLTVPWNLQVLTSKQNAAKSNKFLPDQIELPLTGHAVIMR